MTIKFCFILFLIGVVFYSCDYESDTSSESKNLLNETIVVSKHYCESEFYCTINLMIKNSSNEIYSVLNNEGRLWYSDCSYYAKKSNHPGWYYCDIEFDAIDSTWKYEVLPPNETRYFTLKPVSCFRYPTDTIRFNYLAKINGKDSIINVDIQDKKNIALAVIGNTYVKKWQPKHKFPDR